MGQRSGAVTGYKPRSNIKPSPALLGIRWRLDMNKPLIRKKVTHIDEMLEWHFTPL